MSTKKRAPKAEIPIKLIAYKGFNKDLRCRSYQYEIGKSYTHEGPVEKCVSGFHSCKYPLEVFGYYNPSTSRYARVTASGELSRDTADSKIASAAIKIEAEIRIPDLVSAAVQYILGRIKRTKKGHNTGRLSAATNTGDLSAATNTGDWSAATNTGLLSAATVESPHGKNIHAVAIAVGYQSKAKASLGSAIVCVYRNEKWDLIHIRAGIAGEDVKADTWYMLDENGYFIEV